MSEILQFSNRAEFRNWLMENHDSDPREYDWFLGKRRAKNQLKLERPWKRRFVLGGSTDK